MNIKKSLFKPRFRIVWLFGIVCLILSIVHCANDPTSPSETLLSQAFRELKIDYTSPDIDNDRVTTNVLLPTNLPIDRNNCHGRDKCSDKCSDKCR